MAWETTGEPGPWRTPGFRLFISHVNTQHRLAADLRGWLETYGVAGFVAHADIEPTRDWEQEIIAALRTAEAMAVFLSPDAPASRWVDQESGWALARGLLVIPISLGIDPYGFLARYQALSGHREPKLLAGAVFELLMRDTRTAASMVEAVVGRFERSFSFDNARMNFNLLNQLALDALEIDRICRFWGFASYDISRIDSAP
jgi:hypothetical protein